MCVGEGEGGQILNIVSMCMCSLYWSVQRCAEVCACVRGVHVGGCVCVGWSTIHYSGLQYCFSVTKTPVFIDYFIFSTIYLNSTSPLYKFLSSDR